MKLVINSSKHQFDIDPSKLSILHDMHLKENEMVNIVALYLFEFSDWFVQVINLDKGMQFGELALINDKPRSATIICEKTALCGIIKKEDYKRVIEKMEKR